MPALREQLSNQLQFWWQSWRWSHFNQSSHLLLALHLQQIQKLKRQICPIDPNHDAQHGVT
jgi:hypothetical protein